MSQHQPQGSFQHPYPVGAPQRAKQKPFGWVPLLLVSGATLVLGSCTGFVTGSVAGNASAEPGATVTVTASPEPGPTVTEKPEPAPTVTVTAKPKKEKEPKEKPAEESTEEISDGIYQVGDEVEPGRYRTTVPGGLFALCSYQRLKDDSGDSGSVITYKLANEGEKVSVTIKDGEFFSTDGCGTWKKVS